MMNRRDLFKMFPAVGTALAILPEKPTVQAERAETYHGFKLYWSGWYKHFDRFISTGYWIAQNPRWNGPHVYSAYPGGTCKAYPGDIMDLSVQSWQEFPMPDWSEEKLNRAKDEAYTHLIGYLQRHYEELTHAIR